MFETRDFESYLQDVTFTPGGDEELLICGLWIDYRDMMAEEEEEDKFSLMPECPEKNSCSIGQFQTIISRGKFIVFFPRRLRFRAPPPASHFQASHFQASKFQASKL